MVQCSPGKQGLEALKSDIFEAEDLILSDFVIRRIEDEPDFRKVTEMDRRAFIEHFHDQREAVYWYGYRRAHLPVASDSESGSEVLGIYTPDGELSGFLWVLHDELDEERTVAHILQIYVMPIYRGLGIASTLIDEYLKQADEDGEVLIALENLSGSFFLSSMLEHKGFKEYSKMYIRE